MRAPIPGPRCGASWPSSSTFRVDRDRRPSAEVHRWHREPAAKIGVPPEHPATNRELLDGALRLSRILEGGRPAASRGRDAADVLRARLGAEDHGRAPGDPRGPLRVPPMSLRRTTLRDPRRRGRRGSGVLGHRHAHPGGGRGGRSPSGRTLSRIRGKNALKVQREARPPTPWRPTILDGLVIPGGWAPRQDAPRRRRSSIWPAASTSAGLPIGIICHGGSVAISAGIVGAKATGSLGIKDDLVNVGAEWVDEPAFRDGNLVWGRVVADIPDFCRELMALFTERAAGS